MGENNTKTKSKAFNHNINKWVNVDCWAATHNTIINKCVTNNIECRCLCCKVLNCDTVFSSNVTGKQFILGKEGNFSCKSCNLIYLISCSDCGKQYVGQTTQAVHVRLNAHRSCVGRNTNTILYKHFNDNGHNFSNATIQIIDYVEEYTKTDLDHLENFWIGILSTAFPLGLNDRIEGMGNISKWKGSNSWFYFNKTIPRRRRGHGRKEKVKRALGLNNASSNVETPTGDILMALDNFFTHDLKQFYQYLRALKKNVLHNVRLAASSGHLVFAPILISLFHNTYERGRPSEIVKQRESIVIPFNCKFIDTLSINSILRDKKVSSLLPESVKTRLPLRIFYKYNMPIGRKLLNYNTFLRNLNKDEIKEIISKDCACSSSVYNYNALDHIVTGDLGIINNEKLRNLMSYGAKFREPISMAHNDIKDSLHNYIDHFIQLKACKYQIEVDCFGEWGDKIKGIISNRINFHINHNPNVFDGCISALSDLDVSTYLKEFSKEFIIVVADKAANNYVIVCKKYYTMVLMAELGVDVNSLSCVGNNTYSFVTENKELIISQIVEALKDNFNVNCSKENRKIPNVFWNPKLHKNPYKPRFIAGAKKSVTKELEVLMNKGMLVLKNYFSKYCESIYHRTGINFNWSISSSSEFLDRINTLEIWSMQVYDFSTLYTNLNLQDVEESLHELCDLLFKGQYKYICVNAQKAFFARKKYNGFSCFDKDLFNKAISFFLNNTYVCFAGFVLKQTKGVPMGGGCSSPTADLYLSSKEFKYMRTLLRDKKFALAKLLSNNSRYIDDINIVNYKGFEIKAKEIYPQDLILERSGDNDKDISYLDVQIIIDNNKITTSVYNKVDIFNFPVVNFTFPESNIPIHLGYDVFYGQILRYSTIFSDLNNFMIKSTVLFRLLEGRGYRSDILRKKFKTVFDKNQFTLFKFGLRSSPDALNLLLYHLQVDNVQ